MMTSCSKCNKNMLLYNSILIATLIVTVFYYYYVVSKPIAPAQANKQLNYPAT